ncbi:MAG: GerMN domain-containing protein [Spirochaetes bacterium]|nr:GerMN domain-containing protein [Spirochaetota bacterium]
MASRKKKTSPSTNVGCLVLLVGGIILLVVFAIKFPDIKQTLEKTKFLDLITQRITTTKVPPASKTIQTTVQDAIPTTANPANFPTPKGKSEPSTTVQALPPVETVSSIQGSTQQISLYFPQTDENGFKMENDRISISKVRRTVASSDSPLSDAIKALLAGPSEAETRFGLQSLVPNGTKLLGISLRGSTAVIDLSEAFMFNRYGTEGFGAQLKQIVYTATAFTSVQDVQILVEGKAREYLGGEGIYIGKPLSRNSF